MQILDSCILLEYDTDNSINCSFTIRDSLCHLNEYIY